MSQLGYVVGKRWTDKEITYLKKNYKNMFYSDISKELNREKGATRKMAIRLGLRSGRRGRGQNQKGNNNNNWRGGISKDNYKYRKRTRDRYPEKDKAGRLFRWAVKTGKITRPTICSKCKKHSNRIEGHHEDYSKPLEVKWYCKKCHIIEHKKFNSSLTR